MLVENEKKPSVYSLLFLLLSFIVFSSSGIFAKLASSQTLLSTSFCIYYGLELLVVALYAFLWQIVLKKIDLSIAYMSKSITIIFSLLIAHFMFGELITATNIIGAFFIILGIIVGYRL